MKRNWFGYSKQIQGIASKFGSKLSYLGSGMEGGVWAIDNSYAIKIYRIESKPLNFITELEPKIYDSGELEDNLYWVVKELFDKLDDTFEVIISELIIELAYYVEKMISKSKYKHIEEFSLIAEKALNELLLKSHINIKSLDYVRVHNNLNDNWILNFAAEVSYKFLTDRGLDLHFDNLGIRREDRNLIFFDW